MSAFITSETREPYAVTASVARFTTSITSSHSPSSSVNIEVVRLGKPESRTICTAAATASCTEPSGLLLVGATENATRTAIALLLALGGDRGSSRGGGIRVEVARGARRAEVVVELVDERDAGGDVEPRDVVVGDAVEVLHEGAQRVAVGGDEHGLAGREILRDVRFPVGQHPV